MIDPLRFHVPRKFKPLLAPKRYKGAHGGRGGAKSHFFAEMLVWRCYEKETRAACVREIQNTLKESVRQLIIDKIKKFNLGNFFQILDNEIRGANGSLIIFKGMQSYNAEVDQVARGLRYRLGRGGAEPIGHVAPSVAPYAPQGWLGILVFVEPPPRYGPGRLVLSRPALLSGCNISLDQLSRQSMVSDHPTKGHGPRLRD